MSHGSLLDQRTPSELTSGELKRRLGIAERNMNICLGGTVFTGLSSLIIGAYTHHQGVGATAVGLCMLIGGIIGLNNHTEATEYEDELKNREQIDLERDASCGLLSLPQAVNGVSACNGIEP